MRVVGIASVLAARRAKVANLTTKLVVEVMLLVMLLDEEEEKSEDGRRGT